MYFDSAKLGESQPFHGQSQNDIFLLRDLPIKSYPNNIFHCESVCLGRRCCLYSKESMRNTALITLENDSVNFQMRQTKYTKRVVCIC